MKSMLALRIELLGGGQVAVVPAVPESIFEFIYRTAAGVEWVASERCFLSPSTFTLGASNPMSPQQRFSQLAAALSSELGLHLYVSNETVWVSVPVEIQNAIEAEHAQQ